MTDPLPSAEETLATLREFQQRSARYAFHQLYTSDDPTTRFLVADEVGLGKTLVAKGVIAQTVEYLRSIGDKRTDIVYICSNAAIARQNLRKLNIADDDAVVQADRFTMLTNEIHHLEERDLNLIAVTPGTSLEFGRSTGKFPERALLYAVLQRVWGTDAMRGSGPERLFYLGIKDDSTARRRLREKAARATPTASVIQAFKQQIRRMNERRTLEGEPSVKVEFNRLVKAFRYKNQFDQADRDRRARFLVELRQALATVGIEALQPDLIILDEFQRFRTLLDPGNKTWATRLAHELFDYREPDTGRPTRTLLLSATPYRPYTTADEDEGDSHYEDFVSTAKFLLKDEYAADALGMDLRDLRRSLLVVDRDGGEAAEKACRRVADRLRPVMTRTERLASTPDRSGMLEPITIRTRLEEVDVEGYLAAATAADLLGQRDVVEFWKSGPYLLNFMEGYALKHAFEEIADGGMPPKGLEDLIAAGRGLLDWDEVSRYEEIDPANARLRALVDDTVGRGLWQLLWLPPSLPYYQSDGIFDSPAARSFTKRLVFSAWHLVPKVISALLSHEAERQIFVSNDDAKSRRSYEKFSERANRRLDFPTNAEDGRPVAMANLLAVVPFVELARLADPLEISATLRKGGTAPTRLNVETEAKRRIGNALRPLLRTASRTGPVDQRWYWAGPLLLDEAANPEATLEWWQEALPSHWSGDDSDDNAASGFYRHLDEALDLVESPDKRPLGRVPGDLDEVLAAAALGSPAVCALRSLSRVNGQPIERNIDTLDGAARVAWGFRALYSGPDTTAVVRGATKADSFWRAVLDYGVMGHLQSVLDEYFHVLKDWRGFLTETGPNVTEDLGEIANNALSVRTVSYAADNPRVGADGIEVERHKMRGRFAIRFGDKTIEGRQREQRAQTASEAFNSPFWPFVLSTTSVGQEGLDFHLYSHAVVHWNLPSNPVDFEQREGRVHRYKGHAIRKNVAQACEAKAYESTGDPWVPMFAEAARISGDDGGLAPYWVFNPTGTTARIERHIPLLPLSRDASRLDRLLSDVATYRLSFGQPRQEELLRYLAERVPEADLAEIVQRLRVDLSPGAADP